LKYKPSQSDFHNISLYESSNSSNIISKQKRSLIHNGSI